MVEFDRFLYFCMLVFDCDLV